MFFDDSGAPSLDGLTGFQKQARRSAGPNTIGSIPAVTTTINAGQRLFDPRNPTGAGYPQAIAVSLLC